MKKTTLLLILLLCGVFVASSAMAYTPGSGVPGSPHDLTSGGTTAGFYAAVPADPLNRICIFCHAPHNTYRLASSLGGEPGGGPQAPDAYDYLPLWNHTLPLVDPTYYLYYNGPGEPGNPATNPKSSQAIMLMTGQTAPGGTSLLCLSCHDGSIGVNAYGNSSQPATSQSNSSAGAPFMQTGYIIGQSFNLQNHHPVGFSYTGVQAIDTAIAAPTVNYNTGDPVSNHLYGSAADQMECGTCHSVHNTGNSGETLLWRTDANSGLCLTCHIKGPLQPIVAAPTVPGR